MTLDDSQIVWLGWIRFEADQSVWCSDASVASLLGLPQRTDRDQLVEVLASQGLEHGLEQLRRQGFVSLRRPAAAHPADAAVGGGWSTMVLRELPSPGVERNILVGRPKLASLRELSLVLLREAVTGGSRLVGTQQLQARLGTLFAERGYLAALLRVPDVDGPTQPLFDTGLFVQLRDVLFKDRSGLAPEPAVSLLRQVLASQEPMYLKPSELVELLDPARATADADPARQAAGEEGAARPEPSALGPIAAVLVPASKEVVLVLTGLDLGPEDFGTAEELAQLLLLLHQKLQRQTQDAELVDELRDSVRQLEAQCNDGAHSLTNLLRASRELDARPDLESILTKIAELIREDLGYDIVAVSVIDGKLVHNKVLLGVDDSVRAKYAGLTSRLEELEPFLDPRFRISGSYFIPREADVYTDENRYFLYRPELDERPDGMWQTGDNFLTPLYDAEGRLIGVISLDAPRSGRRPGLEDAQMLELYANRATLAVENTNQISGLTKLNQELQDLDRIRNEFVTNISHELRTPVASILGYAHLLLEHGAENLTERQRHFLSVLAKNTERLSSLVDNLVDISELNADDPTLKCEPLDLREIYREVLVRLESQIRVHRLELRENLGAAPILVLGDRHRLRQVFFAVLSNAILFNREQGLVEVDMEQPTQGTVSVRISDTGFGLSKDKLHEILDRFYQVDHAQVPLEVNSSMGLSIAYKHVRAHRGNLVLQSEEGLGTRVTVTLPVYSAAAERA